VGDPTRTQDVAQSLAAWITENPGAAARLITGEVYRRILGVAVLAMAFALFAWSVAKPEPWRIAAASIFTLMVYLPAWWGERKRR
jgi:hypothetical protein